MGTEDWFESCVEAARALRVRNHWQRYPDLRTHANACEAWRAESAWWDEPHSDVERERSIAQQKAAESGKPPEIVAKMVAGSVQKYLKEVTLLGQVFVKDDKLTIEQLLKSKSASIAAFSLYVVGEGIEKKVSDFAAEVAAQAAAAAHR